MEVLRLKGEQNGLVWAAGEHTRVFYAENIRIAGHTNMWVKATLTPVVRLSFFSFGPASKVPKLTHYGMV